jgi:hypothetical protein
LEQSLVTWIGVDGLQIGKFETQIIKQNRPNLIIIIENLTVKQFLVEEFSLKLVGAIHLVKKLVDSRTFTSYERWGEIQKAMTRSNLTGKTSNLPQR